LADKYLCTRLLNFLLERGLAARLITGQTLPVFLPLVLAIPTLAYGGGLKVYFYYFWLGDLSL